MCSRPPSYVTPSTLFLPPPPTFLSSHPCLSPSKVIVVMFMIVVGFTKFDPELLHPLVPPAHNFEPTAEDKANVSAVGENAKSVYSGRGGGGRGAAQLCSITILLSSPNTIIVLEYPPIPAPRPPRHPNPIFLGFSKIFYDKSALFPLLSIGH